TCAAANCTPPGACCTNGVCAIKIVADCTSGGGYFRGNGSLCTTGICQGGCCKQDGSCTPTNSSALNQSTACTGAPTNGTYAGDGTTCATANCPPGGACCFDNGTCQFLTA